MSQDFDQYCQCTCAPEGSPVSIDYSLMDLNEAFLSSMEGPMQQAFAAMADLEAGAIANPDENRMVGHYWLRDFDRIPDEALREEVRRDDAALRQLISDISGGKIAPPSAPQFRQVLSIGIGGSALGPQLVSDALGQDAGDRMKIHYLDNTDPEGITRILNRLEGSLRETLCIVISKSGGTPETRNGMLLAEAAWKSAGLDFGKHAVAITGPGSKLDKYAEANGWIARVPMYDWVGGRTSVMSSVGLLPIGLQGIDIDQFLAGARAMDGATREGITQNNPAAILALGWHRATGGRGKKDMVVLPYKDRLELFSKYLQQLVMESLGKEHDLEGNVVEQGLTVYGNKGSTDQHAYVQQLRDGVNNFFAVFIEVLKDGGNSRFEVEPGITAGDYLSGFFQGTRQALAEKGRASMTITVDEVSPFTLGSLIALFERAVGFYASLVAINAYHQPGVEAGKKAAATILAVQQKLVSLLGDAGQSAGELGEKAGCPADVAFRVLRHLAMNDRGIRMSGRHPSAAKFSK
ncbi:MAG: glucose-6-phosphate isomerase [Candidatus Sumerlaeia bacterium]|nr:glucose-6-phosphate isomerase [Candidatus Sumerlaeia bacterium]